MWGTQQEAIDTHHSSVRAWRADAEESLAELEADFPRQTFRDRKGREAILDAEKLQLPDRAEPLYFKDITYAESELAWLRQRLILRCKFGGVGKVVIVKCYPKAFKGNDENLFQAFSDYYSRFKAAEEYRTQLAKRDFGSSEGAEKRDPKTPRREQREMRFAESTKRQRFGARCVAGEDCAPYACGM